MPRPIAVRSPAMVAGSVKVPSSAVFSNAYAPIVFAFTRPFRVLSFVLLNARSPIYSQDTRFALSIEVFASARFPIPVTFERSLNFRLSQFLNALSPISVSELRSSVSSALQLANE